MFSGGHLGKGLKRSPLLGLVPRLGEKVCQERLSWKEVAPVGHLLCKSLESFRLSQIC